MPEQTKFTTEEVMKIIQPCLDKIEKGEYASKNEAIDALVADLEAAKDGEEMGGIKEKEGMKLPEEGGEEEE